MFTKFLKKIIKEAVKEELEEYDRKRISHMRHTVETVQCKLDRDFLLPILKEMESKNEHE